MLKIRLKIRKSFQKNFWAFCPFRCQFEIFFNWKTTVISSEKPTGQQTGAMLRVFNILIHEVYQKLDKIEKSLKIGSFFGFCHFWVFFFAKKPHLFLHKRPVDNGFLSSLTFSTFVSTARIEKLTKIALKRKNLESFANFLFLVSFLGCSGVLGVNLKKVRKSPQKRIARS